ncbi:UNVERIFIED_CONTAM: Diphthamide biosynthesis protein 2 [Siphonaria sp. JEL0065]|nr:Diphthamide biosynthesis protein 2 [Siphonaria sp. JEL0065]
MIVSVIDTEVGVVSTTESSVGSDHSSYGRKYVVPEGRALSEYTILYIGAESLTLTNILMTHNSLQSFSYDPALKVAREETMAVNKLLMRRYVMVQKAKDADVVGIVVGTLGVVSYLPLIEHLKRLIIAKGKKPYVIAVGKPSPAKLGNFMEIEVFVLVACPENTLVDSKEFMQPVVTPFELELALVRNKEWTGAYETDLAKLADRIGMEAAQEEKDDGGSDDDDEPHFSLITGAYKQRKQYGTEQVDEEKEEEVVGADGVVTIRKTAGAVSKFMMNSAAAQYLNESRTFKGLEVKLGETAVEEAGQGRAGVASVCVGSQKIMFQILRVLILAFTVTFALSRSPIEGQLVKSELIPELEVTPTTRVILDGGAQVAFVASDGYFVFNDVDDGVHLVEVLSRDYYFPKVRVAVSGNNIAASVHADGTNWNAPGPEMKFPLEIPAKIILDPFTPRPKLSIMGLIMGNPMLLMMGGTMVLFFFLPKMMEGLDPEELKKIQESRANQPKMEMPDVSESLANWFAPTAPAAAPATAAPAVSGGKKK